MTGDAARFDTFARLRHRSLPGRRAGCTPRWCLAWPGTDSGCPRVMNGLKRKPVVLVPACNRQLGEHPFHVVGKKYIDAVRLAGALPLVVPTALPEDLDALLDLADGCC